MDRTLKQHGGLLRSRSVLTRAERIAQLLDEGKYDKEKDSPFGLPKTRVYHSKAGTKTKKAAAEAPAEGEGEGAEAAAAAPAEGEAKAAEARAPEAKGKGKGKE
jgi:small basic protein (TIGR04137 family)